MPPPSVFSDGRLLRELGTYSNLSIRQKLQHLPAIHCGGAFHICDEKIWVCSQQFLPGFLAIGENQKLNVFYPIADTSFQQSRTVSFVIYHNDSGL